MAVFPISSNFEGDFVLQLIPVDTDDTMDQVAEKCAYHSVGRRVAPQPDKIMRVRVHQATESLPRDMKVSEAGWRPTETIDIIFADQ
ncbi:MAG: toluene-4-monooxygenase system B family protein [Cycloclasticus sp.]|jgi:toluene monooxygenase system protein B|nr:MAG: toluene monooxygenase [Cycloclasticus sp. Phe_18]MBV1912434.1 toluene-4-monooxygenase system B family protein [Cycloclasticus sp.]MDF1689508.1 toluene-4-monooxygenase system B family protein [Cycloclasticus sp.]MEE4290515.1 toluene-4-monooxygenase system B family protein [Cycloclasticus sp.]